MIMKQGVAMKTALLRAGIAMLAFTAGSANAAGLLGNYTVAWQKPIQTQEASAIAYNWDTHTLMVTNDEEDGDWSHFGEYDLSGKKVANIDVPGCLSLGGAQCDPEGLTYIGKGQYVVGEERYQDIARLSLTNTSGSGDSLTHTYTDYADAPTVSIGGDAGNKGLEGVAYNRETGDYFAVKETSPQTIWKISDLDWDSESANVTTLFDISSLGLETLSDIAVLSNGLFAGTAFGDNLLILSGTSKAIYEVTQTGELVSTFDLSSFYDGDIGRVPPKDYAKFEGLTLDDQGNIYLVSDDGDGVNQSYLVKLAYNAPGPVPEPGTWAMMLAGFGLVGYAARRSTRRAAIA